MPTSARFLRRRQVGARGPRRWGRRPTTTPLSVEPLEVRWLPSVSPIVVQPNETIDQAQDLGTLGRPVEASGSIGDGPEGAADVTWYRFTLDHASRVNLKVNTPAGDLPFASVLSLFNSDLGDYGDPYDLDGYRLMDQVQANPAGGIAECVQDLAPGTYFVAISGAGNTAFSPVIAGSGFDGATGDFDLTVSATDLGLSHDGPTMIASEPAAGSVLDSSPLAIRVELSRAIDGDTITTGQTVQLLSVSGGSTTPIALASVNLSSSGDELQLFPLAPLAPGNYTVQLSGDSSDDPAVLATSSGVPLGEDAQHPEGADESFSFQVAGIDGVAGAPASDDTPATARDLGDVTGLGLVQVAGAIGDDPAFNPALSPDPTDLDPQDNPANQVDLYHFQIVGPGRYAVLAEVFAGRIGSPLDPGISLFELDPSTGSLVFLAGNNNTLNPTQGTDGSSPLLTDSELSDGLTAGDYYLAVADGSNTPSPLEFQPPGSPGILDPNQPGSAQNGSSTGPYLLNLMVQPTPDPPQVVASSPTPGQVLGQAPTQITVQFSEPVDIQQLAYDTFEATYQETLPQVYIAGADGTTYYARLSNYDSATNTATFLMLDGLPDGSYALHLSGPGGLTDFGGNPLVSNDPSGDYVIPFSVNGPDRGISGNMTDGYRMISQAGQGATQDIGVLFPDELQAGVEILRYAQSGTGAGSSSARDEYAIQLLQNQQYSFQLIGGDLPSGAHVTVTDASGKSIPLLSSYDGNLFFGTLRAGTYTVSVGGWPSGDSASIAYKLVMKLDQQQDNPPPLVDGPAPALQISLAAAGPISGEVPIRGREVNIQPTGDGAGSGSSTGGGTESGSSTGDGAGSGGGPVDVVSTVGSVDVASAVGGPVDVVSTVGGPVDVVSTVGGPVDVASTVGGPVSGPWSSVEGPSTGGGSAATGSSGGGSGPAGSSAGESIPASPGAVPALTLAQNEDMVGLSGLGLSPLGGAGGQTGVAASPTIQVALSAPSAGVPVVGQFALSLVTLTSMISTNREGEAIESVDVPLAPRPETADQPGSSAWSDATADRSCPVIDAPWAGGPKRGTGAANDLPPDEGPRGMVIDLAATGLVPPPAHGALVTEQGAPIDGPPPRPSGPGTAVDVEEQGQRTGTWAARLVIAGAIVTAAFRTRGPIRGLHWRKRADVGARRSDGTIAHPPHDGPVLAHPASRPGAPDGLAGRCPHGSTVASPVR